MFVNNKQMYHFHNTKAYDDVWFPSNEIIVDENFKTHYLNILDVFSTSVDTKKQDDVPFDRVIDFYLEDERDKQLYIDLLKESRRIIIGANIFKRELALELIRKEKYPNLPSRRNSIWLCDENGIDFWKEQLSSDKNNLDLYKVSVTGELFKTNDTFIPNDESNFYDNLIEADKYWNPNLSEVDETKNEYLFQGKVKVLELVK